MMPLAAGLAKSLGKRIGKADSEAVEISGRLTAHLSEILKASKMIRIYQKEEVEFQKSKNIIFEMVNKGAKISSIIVRATPLMEILTGFMIAGFIFLRLRGILGKRTGFDGKAPPQFQDIENDDDRKI